MVRPMASIPAGEIIAAELASMVTAQVTARVRTHIAAMLSNALYFECSLAPRELFPFRKAFKKVIDGIALGMGYGSRDEMVGKSRLLNVGELIEFMLRLRHVVERRFNASQATILSLYYGKELLPCSGLMCAMIQRIKGCTEKADNEIVKIAMEILYGCVMLAIPAMLKEGTAYLFRLGKSGTS